VSAHLNIKKTNINNNNKKASIKKLYIYIHTHTRFGGVTPHDILQPDLTLSND